VRYVLNLNCSVSVQNSELVDLLDLKNLKHFDNLFSDTREYPKDLGHPYCFRLIGVRAEIVCQPRQTFPVGAMPNHFEK